MQRRQSKQNKKEVKIGMRKLILSLSLTVTFAVAGFALNSGSLQAEEWKWCCAATAQCQTAANQACDDVEDCSGPGECCVDIFQCKVAPPNGD